VFSPFVKLRLFQFKSIIDDKFIIKGVGILAPQISIGSKVKDVSITSQMAMTLLISRKVRFKSLKKNVDT
jgi:hypothetical protein